MIQYNDMGALTIGLLANKQSDQHKILVPARRIVQFPYATVTAV